MIRRPPRSPLFPYTPLFRSVAPPILLEARGLTCLSDRGRPALRGLSFEVRCGEILGVAGVDGNGQAELAEGLTGLRRAGGTAFLEGETAFHRSAAPARRAGVAHLPRDPPPPRPCLPLHAEE